MTSPVGGHLPWVGGQSLVSMPGQATHLTPHKSVSQPGSVLHTQFAKSTPYFDKF